MEMVRKIFIFLKGLKPKRLYTKRHQTKAVLLSILTKNTSSSKCYLTPHQLRGLSGILLWHVKLIPMGTTLVLHEQANEPPSQFTYPLIALMARQQSNSGAARTLTFTFQVPFVMIHYWWPTREFASPSQAQIWSQFNVKKIAIQWSNAAAHALLLVTSACVSEHQEADVSSMCRNEPLDSEHVSPSSLDERPNSEDVYRCRATIAVNQENSCRAT